MKLSICYLTIHKPAEKHSIFLYQATVTSLDENEQNWFVRIASFEFSG